MDATAATVSGKPPAAPRGRRLGILAGAATAALAVLVLFVLRVSGVPEPSGPGAPDDHLSGAEHQAQRAVHVHHRYSAALRLASERGAALCSLCSATRVLCRHGWLQLEVWLARCVDMLLSGHRGGTFARLLHRLASPDRSLDGEVAAPLGAAVAYLARRRRLLPHHPPR